MLKRHVSSTSASCLAVALTLIVALAGCGGTSGKKASSVIPLTSPAIVGGAIPARYTCDGANIAPPLSWGAVPPGVNELVLFALGVRPGGSSMASDSIEWVMAGINPQLHAIAAGKLPSGAVLLEASDKKRHYSICPPKGHPQRYDFAVFAVPPAVRVGTEIPGVPLLKNLVYGPPGGTAQDDSPAKGQLLATYERR